MSVPGPTDTNDGDETCPGRTGGGLVDSPDARSSVTVSVRIWPPAVDCARKNKQAT